MNMLKIMLAAMLAAFSFTDGALAAGQSSWSAGYEMAQANSRSRTDENRDRPGWRPGWRPGVMRQTSYYCALDNGGGCPSGQGRVGQRCRCAGQTGGGRLTAR